MLMIRLQRVGRKNVPTFRVVLIDRRNSTKSGRFLERLGAYDPRKGGIRQFDAPRIKELIANGAKPSDTLHNLLIDEKVIEGKKINVLPKKSPTTKKKDAGKKGEVGALKIPTSSVPAEEPVSDVKVPAETPKPESTAPSAPTVPPAPSAAPEKSAA